MDSRPAFRCRVYRDVSELDNASVDRWRRLEENALHGNVYLSPDFLIPSLVHLPPAEPVTIVMVEHTVADTAEAVFMGIFTELDSSMKLPIRCLDTYRAPHAYLTGMLIREGFATEALACFFTEFLERSEPGWSALRLTCYPKTLATNEPIESALRQQGIRWHDYAFEPRAAIRPPALDADYLENRLSKKTLRNYARKQRKLTSMGRYEWRLVPAGEVSEKTISDFLRLENLGWKGETRTSLLSDRKQALFFEDMITRMSRRGKVFFTEIRLDGETIASTSNLRSGRHGFAFKLGWDPAFAQQSIGILNELELIRSMPDTLATLDHIDSGAMPGSFMESLWPETEILKTGFYTTGFGSRLCIELLCRSAKLKRSLSREPPP